MATRLVWLKRDLRLHDHLPLAVAAEGAAAALWIVEPEWLASPEFHPRHYVFAARCVAEMREALAARGLPLLVRVGGTLDVLDRLHRQAGFDELLSHEETGPGWTYERDKAVAAWCRGRGVVWREWPQHGVIRRLRERRGWAGRWEARMSAPEVPMLAGWSGWGGGAPELGPLPTWASLAHHTARLQAPAEARQEDAQPWDRAGPDTLQTAGERAGLALLDDFLAGRGRGYRRSLSSPLTAEEGCSRLSPHLALGTLSLRRVHQATEAAIAQARDARDAALASGLRGFSGRLRWHCHFMQKLEDEPGIEFRSFARSCDGLRPGEEAPGAPVWGAEQDARLQAWQDGRTGFPMVDACMRSLRATGWLNFRMRAMLVSFASYHLWLHWRPTGLHLARQYTDFEAGIHWSQMQMQSGTTGINTLRIYSPTKQAQDQDPQGDFIRRWVPELARVPLPFLARPWMLDAAQQREAGCVIDRDYPSPVVDEKAALKAAKDAMFGLRGSAQSRAEADRIQARHGSRRSGLPQTGLGRRGAPPKRSGPERSASVRSASVRSASDTQLDLFDMPNLSPSADESR